MKKITKKSKAKVSSEQVRASSVKNAGRKKDLISKEMTFAEIMEKHPDAANILFNSGMHCIGCGMAMYESLEQGCMMHGMTKKQIDNLIKKLNKEGK